MTRSRARVARAAVVAILVASSSATVVPSGVSASALPSGRDAYRTPADVERELATLATQNPGLVRAVVLPRRSVQGRPIAGVEIAKDVNRADDGRPVWIVLGLHHAREWPSAEVAVELARDLVARQAEPRIAALLNRLRVVVVPVVNPDGYLYSRGTAPGGQPDATAARKRRSCRVLPGDPGTGCGADRGVDLNRNYGAFWGGAGASTDPDSDQYRGPAPWSEPESAAVHELTQNLPVTGVQALHSIAGLILRPPGFRALGRAPDETKLRRLGDAMAAAAGYESRRGFDLYEVNGAAEDWNYIAQGAFGYTIELGGASGDDREFQGPYATHVVDQYLGRAGTSAAGKGVREALLLSAEQAADPRDHLVVRGPAPAGTTLSLRKSFTTVTSRVCADTLSADTCGPTAPALRIPDFLQVGLTVGGGSVFAWHVGPSVAPYAREAGKRETWTLSCAVSGGATVVKRVYGWRGDVVDVAPCEEASLPVVGRSSDRAVVVRRVSVRPATNTRRSALASGSVRLALRCPVTCRGGSVLMRASAGGAVLARRTAVTLRAGRQTLVGVSLTAAGRRALARTVAPRTLRAAVLFRTPAGGSATVVRRVPLPAR